MSKALAKKVDRRSALAKRMQIARGEMVKDLLKKHGGLIAKVRKALEKLVDDCDHEDAAIRQTAMKLLFKDVLHLDRVAEDGRGDDSERGNDRSFNFTVNIAPPKDVKTVEVIDVTPIPPGGTDMETTE